MGEATGVFQKVLSGDLQEKIEQAVFNLPPKCQSIFMMSRYDGMKNKEIAEATGLSVKTVEKQLGIALKKIKFFSPPVKAAHHPDDRSTVTNLRGNS